MRVPTAKKTIKKAIFKICKNEITALYHHQIATTTTYHLLLVSTNKDKKKIYNEIKPSSSSYRPKRVYQMRAITTTKQAKFNSTLV